MKLGTGVNTSSEGMEKIPGIVSTRKKLFLTSVMLALSACDSDKLPEPGVSNGEELTPVEEFIPDTASPQTTESLCPTISAPVCALNTDNDTFLTYQNACTARINGVLITADGQCGEDPGYEGTISPVCATMSDGLGLTANFVNAQVSEAIPAYIVTIGECD